MKTQQQHQPPGVAISVIATAGLSAAQRVAIRRLQEQCFAAVPIAELVEDFVAEAVARVLAEEAGDLVGCLSVFRRTIVDGGRPIALGGIGGTCTRPDRRGQGIGTAVCRAGLAALAAAGCDVAFLAIGAGDAGIERFYAQLGFVPLARPFTFVNAHGRTRHPPRPHRGMLAPVGSPECVALIANGTGPLHLGPAVGYW